MQLEDVYATIERLEIGRSALPLHDSDDITSHLKKYRSALLALVYVSAALAVDPTFKLTLISHVSSIWCA